MAAALHGAASRGRGRGRGGGGGGGRSAGGRGGPPSKKGGPAASPSPRNVSTKNKIRDVERLLRKVREKRGGE